MFREICYIESSWLFQESNSGMRKGKEGTITKGSLCLASRQKEWVAFSAVHNACLCSMRYHTVRELQGAGD